jgi:subtilisin family serine protease
VVPASVDTAGVRRPVIALLAALLGVVWLAAPASAGATTDIVVGHPDGSFVVRSVPAATAGADVARAERQPGVAWAEVDAPVHASGAITPNDPEFAKQWGPIKVRAPEAWGRTTGDSSAVIAVVDTGVDATQPDLAGAVLAGADFINDGKSGDPAGHGTGVAGVIAARGNNGQGIAGYCWGCKILPVRSLDATGTGSSASVAAGIQWATTHGADVINLSLAGDATSITLDVAIAQARAAGVLVVAAAGNQTKAGQDLTLPQYPAATDGVIGVVATNETDGPYSWTYRGAWADLAAPGCVRTTAPGGAYANECGTSFASPAVAGIIGLAISAFPKAPPAAIEAALYGTTSPLATVLAQHGRVDAAALLDSLGQTYPSVVEPERVAGTDRIATAVALSQRAHTAADTVIVARADTYADALAAAPLAGRFSAPVLLTGSSTLAPAVAAEVRRLGATTAWVVGGEQALSPAVADGLRAAGATDVRRLAGSSRYDTAALIARQLGSSSAFVTQAGGWADAVAVSGLAAQTGRPILLVDRDGVPAVTAQALADLHPSTITVVGGPGVVSDGVVATLGATGASVGRLAGANRYETSRAVADASKAAGADPVHTWVATGADWPDALAAGPAAASQGAVLLLVDGQSAAGSPSVTAWLTALGHTLRELVVVGGESSIGIPTLSSLTATIGA